MCIFAIALLCLAVVPVTPIHHDIHKRMTNEEVFQTFQTDHAGVPDYDVVRVDVSNIEKRDTQNRRLVRMTGRNTNVKVLLECADGFLAGENTPVVMARRGRNEIIYDDMPYVMRKVGKLMEDPHTRSSMFMSKRSSGRHAINGHIESRNLVVRSLPDHLSDEVSRKARSVNDSGSSDNSLYHIVYEPQIKLIPPKLSTRLLNDTVLEPVLNRNSRDIPDIIYPKVQLVADYSSYRFHGSDAVNIVRYMLALWNSADMRYRELTQPKIRINIARIILADKPDGTPYIFAKVINGNIVNADSALDEAGKYFYSIKKEFPLTSYDAVMMMTKQKLMTDDGGSPAGYASVGAARQVDEYRKKFVGNGIFEDKGVYASVTPAHELGHILGSSHDVGKCEYRDNYVMAPVTRADVKPWSFSPCSVRDFRNFLHSRNTQVNCMRRIPPNTGKLVPRILGGSFSSLDEQCQQQGGSGVCPFSEVIKNPDVCAQLYCRAKNNPNSCTWNIGVGALDGTPCHGNGICVQNKCQKIQK